MWHAIHMPLNISSYSIIQAMKSVHGFRGKGRMTKSKMLSWMWRHVCNPSIRDSEAGGWGVQGQLWLYGEFEGLCQALSQNIAKGRAAQAQECTCFILVTSPKLELCTHRKLFKVFTKGWEGWSFSSHWVSRLPSWDLHRLSTRRVQPTAQGPQASWVST